MSFEGDIKAMLWPSWDHLASFCSPCPGIVKHQLLLWIAGKLTPIIYLGFFVDPDLVLASSGKFWLSRREKPTAQFFSASFNFFLCCPKIEIPTGMEVPLRYKLLTLFSLFTVYTAHIFYTFYTVNIIQTALHCLNSSLYAYTYCYKVRIQLE